ncbi:MAG: hypothetical protein ACI4WS_05520 [Oscillospiraceae bacterium]
MDILKQIMDIDKAAAARVEALRAEQAQKLESSGIAAAKASEKLIADEQKKLEEFRSAQQSALDKKQGGAEAAKAAEIKRLDDIFAANRDKWSAEILEKVTGV